MLTRGKKRTIDALNDATAGEYIKLTCILYDTWTLCCPSTCNMSTTALVIIVIYVLTID